MIEALGWIMVAMIVAGLGKQIGKILFPDDWKDKY
jgi:hypothetical protein